MLLHLNESLLCSYEPNVLFLVTLLTPLRLKQNNTCITLHFLSCACFQRCWNLSQNPLSDRLSTPARLPVYHRGVTWPGRATNSHLHAIYSCHLPQPAYLYIVRGNLNTFSSGRTAALHTKRPPPSQNMEFLNRDGEFSKRQKASICSCLLIQSFYSKMIRGLITLHL